MFFLTFFVILFHVKFVKTDTPARCKKNWSYFVGKIWTMHVSQLDDDPSESKSSLDIFTNNNFCGHTRPNSV